MTGFSLQHWDPPARMAVGSAQIGALPTTAKACLVPQCHHRQMIPSDIYTRPLALDDQELSRQAPAPATSYTRLSHLTTHDAHHLIHQSSLNMQATNDFQALVIQLRKASKAVMDTMQSIATTRLCAGLKSQPDGQPLADIPSLKEISDDLEILSSQVLRSCCCI